MCVEGVAEVSVNVMHVRELTYMYTEGVDKVSVDVMHAAITDMHVY